MLLSSMINSAATLEISPQNDNKEYCSNKPFMYAIGVHVSLAEVVSNGVYGSATEH